MVAPIVAAAAPAVISSATNDDGLVNKLFKIGILIGILVLAVISIFIFSWVLDISNVVGGTGEALGLLFQPFRLAFGGFALIGPAVTYVLTAFSFGGRR